MIIGIDEVGDFAVGSQRFNYFIAVAVQQGNNGVQKKHQQFKAWMNSIDPSQINTKGEVKGTDLTDAQLYNFAQSVVATDPIVGVTQYRILPSENPESVVENFRQAELRSIDVLIRKYRNENRPRIAEEYQRMNKWYRDRNYQHLLKILTLRHSIPDALRKAVGTSILLELLPYGTSYDLMNIKIKIDRDFINTERPRLFFGELLRSSFAITTRSYPIPALNTWEKTGHPFLTKYGRPNGQVDFREILVENCHFLNSHEHFEIQIADIVGTIVHRYKNRQKCKDAYDMMVSRLSKQRHEIIHFSFGS